VRKVSILLIIAVILGACTGPNDIMVPVDVGTPWPGEAMDSGDAEEEAPVDPEAATAGEEIFKRPIIGALAGCTTCHSLEPDLVIVGPSLAGIGSRAGSAVEGQSAEEYIHTSIVSPNEHIVEGFAEGLMPQGFGDQLSDEELDDLVSYLLSLE